MSHAALWSPQLVVNFFPLIVIVASAQNSYRLSRYVFFKVRSYAFCEFVSFGFGSIMAVGLVVEFNCSHLSRTGWWHLFVWFQSTTCWPCFCLISFKCSDWLEFCNICIGHILTNAQMGKEILVSLVFITNSSNGLEMIHIFGTFKETLSSPLCHFPCQALSGDILCNHDEMYLWLTWSTNLI